MLEITIGRDLHDRAVTCLEQRPVIHALVLPPAQRRADALELTQDPRASSRVGLPRRDVLRESRGIAQDPLHRWIRSCLDSVLELQRTGIALDPTGNQHAYPQSNRKVPLTSIHAAILPHGPVRSQSSRVAP
jgi:hypothetical protein